MRHIRKCFRAVPVIAQVESDSPETAFEMLRLGAFVAIDSLVVKAERLWDLIGRAISNSPPYDRLLTMAPRGPKRAFMSMTYNPFDQNNVDYRRAVRPALKHLGWEVYRADDGSDSAVLDVRLHVEQSIAARPVLIALMSSYTGNVTYEIGFASSCKKQILLLRRSGSSKLPVLITGMRRVEYHTMTELAMKLFFGLPPGRHGTLLLDRGVKAR